MSTPTKCARCGRENDPAFSFCLDCGGPLRDAAAHPPAPACSACGTALQPGFRFCGHCGAPATAALASAPRTPPPVTPSRRLAPAGHPALTPSMPLLAPDPPAAGAPLRVVTVRSDGLPGAVFDLAAEETVCGRSDGTLRLADDATVSPRHARFTLRRGALVVEDLGSVNGTFVRIRTDRRLHAGDALRVGRQVLRVEPSPPQPAPAPDGVRAWGRPDPGCRVRLAQLLDGGGVGELFPLPEGDHLLGRDTGDVTFPSDRYVSARHARLSVRGDAVTVTDLGSSNGTFVRIAVPTELAPGDQLLVGTQLLRVEG
jgi:pSer/pThr/pTyr-binding forkhead associated (FHA) protein